jgi:NAD(P)-dependent dehydrogenase (short-subunit alcohol dehydrogenase family)
MKEQAMGDRAIPDYLALLRLDGRGFVVLGTGAGIGGEVCHALTQAGARVLCVDLSLETAQKTAEAVGGEAMAANIADRRDMETVFAKAEALFGKNFYGVVDVVGVPVPGALADLDDAAYDRQHDLVVRHAWLAISIAGPMLARNGGGSIVFIGSLGGYEYFPNVGLYCAAKAGLNALARTAAIEYGPSGVRVNVIAPGRVKASGLLRPNDDVWPVIEAAIPLRRAGEPHDVAAAVLFMASDMAAYITGEVTLVDGGIYTVTAMPNP